MKKKVMELKAENKGIIGVVADIIKVEKRFETAVETSLGGNIQNIVTDTDETAKEMINFIKKNKFGRATFLPMSSIVADAPYDKKLDDEKGVLGPVSDFVDTKPEYKEIIKYLIGRFVLVDNIDNALKLAKKYNRTLRIVTLEGEFLNVGGSISGGAFKNKGNLLARKREIDELTSKLDDTKEHIDVDDVLIDGKSQGDIGELVLKDREMLGENGIVIISATVDRATKKLLAGPEVLTRGFIYVKENQDIVEETKKICLDIILKNISEEEKKVDYTQIKNEVRETLGKYFYKETEAKPMIITVIQEV